MKVEEFRIGNFVRRFDNEPDEFHFIERIGKDTIGIFLDQYVVNCKLHELDPIPLTEEWLIRFGFEKEYEGHGCYAFLNKECRIYILTDDTFEFELNTLSERHNLCRQYKFVHQFQNLYFCLTGQELTLSTSQR